MFKTIRRAPFRPMDFAQPFRHESYDFHGVTFHWTGVASCVLEYEGQRLAIDPFVTRPSMSQVLFRKLKRDTSAIDRWIPPCDVVVVGHSHYDHLLDAPYVAARDGSQVVGSHSTARVMRAEGVPSEHVHTLGEEGGTVEIGPFRITLVPSRHCRVLLGRVPFPGEIAEDFEPPARASEYRMGSVYGVLVEVGGLTFYHNGSADLDDEALRPHRADVALIGLAGAAETDRYFERLLTSLEPRYMVPIHWDAFFEPLEEGMRILPNVDFTEFFSSAKTIMGTSELLVPEWNPERPLALRG
jgi:L-ascorbate metabolism protein UlaG (beta-lactamase superfamily)